MKMDEWSDLDQTRLLVVVSEGLWQALGITATAKRGGGEHSNRVSFEFSLTTFSTASLIHIQ